jgi:hypothetical protein
MTCGPEAGFELTGAVMKCWLCLCALVYALVASSALAVQEAATAPSTTLTATASTSPSAVERWGVFDQSFPGPATGNPFLDVELSAKFSCGDRALTVFGFYDGDGVYRIRFMPSALGHWSFVTQSNCPRLAGLTGSFECVAPTEGNHGPVSVAGTHHFAYADGTPFVVIGTTSYSWVHQPDALEDQTLKTLRKSPFDKLRMCILPSGQVPIFYPYARDAAGKFDAERFNPEFFRHLEKRIEELSRQGVQADLILFHPYQKGEMRWFDDLDDAAHERYLKYIVDRLSAYRNVWWSLANEYSQVKHKTDRDWDEFFSTVAPADPYGHLRSIHNSARIYDPNKPWVTHASIQNGLAVADFGRAALYREMFPKPLVYDEVCYEGNIPARWGHLTGREMVERFWMGTIGGAYVGHGETFPSPNKTSWTDQGGELMGESPARLAFLRQILEAGPAEGIEPIDEYWQTHVGGRAGQYYLVYFGTEQPTSWQFALPRDPPNKLALAAGMKFHVDILDTWNMTITPVDRVFTAGAPAGSVYPAVGDSLISLPGKPDIALRIRHVN